MCANDNFIYVGFQWKVLRKIQWMHENANDWEQNIGELNEGYLEGCVILFEVDYSIKGGNFGVGKCITSQFTFIDIYMYKASFY